MRLVHRLSQYQRLYHQLGSAPVAVTIGELAAMFYCSERHARTLVQQLQDQGWLSWHSQPGRGKRARLHCLKTPDELRAQLLQQLLQQGNHQGALEMAQLQLAKQMRENGEQGSIVTLLCDSGERYLDTYYNPEWVSNNIGDLQPYLAQLADL